MHPKTLSDNDPPLPYTKLGTSTEAITWVLGLLQNKPHKCFLSMHNLRAHY